MASISQSQKCCSLAAYSIIRGDLEAGDIGRSIMKIKERRMLQFAPWCPSSLFVNHVKKAPSFQSEGISGALLINNTGITETFRRTCDQFDRLRKRNAFLDMYKRESSFNIHEEFDEAR